MMKNHKNIKRLFEQEAISQADVQELGMQPEMPSFDQSTAPALPAPGETAAPSDPMTMTVGDFITKCKEIDPLVCMGIESFIEKNRANFGHSNMQPAMMAAQPDSDLTFSNAVAPVDNMNPPMPAQTDFLADQSQDSLNFPA